MEHGAEAIRKHVRVYITVFVALLFLTVVTVAVSFLEVSVPVAIVIAMVIASFKASLVACYFMHLIGEKQLIYWVLIISAVFLLVMLLVPVLTGGDMLTSADVS
ncbi:MAG: hypothetical protein CMJ18_26035 [Phycisphaeraceae bacterium]|nr:hypothetical protein [Phycisphaeraceae bacterium]